MRNSSRDTKAVDSYADSIKHLPRIDRAREIVLGRRIREGKDEDARNELVEANLRFALDMAMKYRDRGRDDMDLVSDANYGLMEAAWRFDERIGTKFVVQAYQWVRGAIAKGFKDENEIVHVPQAGRTKAPTAPLNAEDLEEQEAAAEVARIEAEVCSTPLGSHVYPVVSRQPSLAEVDQCIHEPGNVEDDGLTDSSFEEIDMRLTMESLLDSREQYIITESVQHGRTMADVGKALGISRERVRQIRDAALLKLREEIA